MNITAVFPFRNVPLYLTLHPPLTFSALNAFLSLLFLIPKLHIPIRPYPSPPNQLPFIPHNILERDPLIGKNLQMIADHVSVLTLRACD